MAYVQGKKYLRDTVLRVSLEAAFRYPRHNAGHPQRHQLTAFRCQEATDHRKEI